MAAKNEKTKPTKPTVDAAPIVPTAQGGSDGSGKSLGAQPSQPDGFRAALGGGDVGTKKGRPSEADKKAQADLREAIDAITNPKILGDVLCAYFDARFATTGHKPFYVDEEQRARMGSYARVILKSVKWTDNPLYYAIGMLAFEVGRTALTAEISYYMLKHPKKEKSADGSANPAGERA